MNRMRTDVPECFHGDEYPDPVERDDTFERKEKIKSLLSLCEQLGDMAEEFYSKGVLNVLNISMEDDGWVTVKLEHGSLKRLAVLFGVSFEEFKFDYYLCRKAVIGKVEFVEWEKCNGENES